MFNWHPGVLPVALFVIGFGGMFCYTMMKHDAPKTTIFAGIGAFLVTVGTMAAFGLWTGAAILGGMIFGYVVAQFAFDFFDHMDCSYPQTEAEPTVVREPVSALLPTRHWVKRDNWVHPSDLLHGSDHDDEQPLLVFGRHQDPVRSGQLVDERV